MGLNLIPFKYRSKGKRGKATYSGEMKTLSIESKAEVIITNSFTLSDKMIRI